MADYRKIRAVTWRSWLDGLPEEIYDKRETSHIVRLMDALCGEGGVGRIRRGLLLKRLQTSLDETRYGDLDTVYSAIFALPRLSSERYEYSPDALLLLNEMHEMNIKDAAYRKRIWAYMLSFQYGGTVQGLSLAAQAATGLPCAVIDGCMYYRALGADEADELAPNYGQPINFDNTIDFNGVTIVVMTDGKLTTEQEYSLSSVTSRLRPVDVRYTFMTRSELMEKMLFNDLDVDDITPLSVSASSRWWDVSRMVTGRPDWNESDSWVEAGVTKEAPVQLMVNSQETIVDYTGMVKSAGASSVHFGAYRMEQRDIFPSLADKAASIEHPAGDAVSAASDRLVTLGYYGDSYAIDGSYPVELAGEMTRFSSEVARSFRFWSSEERRGAESIEVTLKRIVPVNRVSFSIFRKPVTIRLKASSFVDSDGERLWVDAVDAYGSPLVFVCDEWGGRSGETVAVDFDFETINADAFRLDFERGDIPYRVQVGEDVYEELDFPFSIEVSDFSVRHMVRYERDFEPATYEDAFGNRVDTFIRTMDADRCIDGSLDTYWLSQPNVGEHAVEYLVFRLSETPVKMNRLKVDAIFGGCQMNVYSAVSDMEEPEEWTPYPQPLSLSSGIFELPTRVVTHIKLEFTMLSAIPYSARVPGVMVRTRRFPWVEKEYAESRWTLNHEMSRAQQMLAAPEPPYDAGTIRQRVGIEDEYADAGPRISGSENVSVATASMTRTGEYRQDSDSPIVAVYRDDMAVESAVIAPYAESFGNAQPSYMFFTSGTHEYEVGDFERADDLAYVVGIREVTFGYGGSIMSADISPEFTLDMSDERFIAENDGWVAVSDSRVMPQSGNGLSRIETVDVQSVYPFRSFEFVSNQRPPIEVLRHPSDMYEEWTGVGTSVSRVDFGTSGTVLRMDGDDSGPISVETSRYLIRSMAIARAQVDVFPMQSGEWKLEASDMFAEKVFDSTYQLPARKWSTVGIDFVPQPGGSWWDGDYPFRVRVPLSGPLARGQVAFTPVIDEDAIIELAELLKKEDTHNPEAVLSDDEKANVIRNIRVIWWNGTEPEELPTDRTANEELWFRIQQDVPTGIECDGSYDFENGILYGVYYVYFGNYEADPDNPSLVDYHEVFDRFGYMMGMSWGNLCDFGTSKEAKRFLAWGDSTAISAVPSADGTGFSSMGDCAIMSDQRLRDAGFVSFELDADSVSGDTPRFVFDYDDGSMLVQCYIRSGRFAFVMVDTDSGTESAFLSGDGDVPAGRTFIEWCARGDAAHRSIRVYTESDGTPPYVEVVCAEDVYDERRFVTAEDIYQQEA